MVYYLYFVLIVKNVNLKISKIYKMAISLYIIRNIKLL